MSCTADREQSVGNWLIIDIFLWRLTLNHLHLLFRTLYDANAAPHLVNLVECLTVLAEIMAWNVSVHANIVMGRLPKMLQPLIQIRCL